MKKKNEQNKRIKIDLVVMFLINYFFKMCLVQQTANSSSSSGSKLGSLCLKKKKKILLFSVVVVYLTDFIHRVMCYHLILFIQKYVMKNAVSTRWYIYKYLIIYWKLVILWFSWFIPTLIVLLLCGEVPLLRGGLTILDNNWN